MFTEIFETHCFLCGAVARCKDTDHGNRRHFQCTKCGEYEISHTAMGRLDTSADFKNQASEAIRRLRDSEEIYEIVLDPATMQASGRAVPRRPELS